MRKYSKAVLALGLAIVSSSSFVLPAHPSWGRQKAPETEDAMKKNFDIGIAYFKKEDYDGAIDAFLQSIYFARNNYAPESQLWLGYSYMAKHEDIKAIEAAKKNLEQSIGSPYKGHIMLAELYLRNKRLEEADHEAYEAISATNDRCFDGHRARFVYGQVWEAKGDFENAQRQYEYALGDTPWTYTEAWLAYTEMMMKGHNWVGAVAQFKAMLESLDLKLTKADQVRIYRDLGKCLLSKGDHQGALMNWHKALGLDIGDFESHLDLAMMFDAESHITSAIKEYKEFIRYSTDPRKVAKAKQRLEMLEQKIAPVEAPYEVKPSPYLRRQMDQQSGGQPRQPQDTGPVNPKDSGF